MIVEFHRLAALLTAAGGLVVLGIVIGRSMTGRPLRFARDRAILAAAVLTALAALSGLALLATTNGPHEVLHLVYATAALLTLPVARFGGGALSRHRSASVALGALITLALVVRLYQTG